MTTSSKAELILLEAAPIPAGVPAPVPDQEPEHVRAALKRCHAAWQRAYKAHMDKTNGNDGDDVFATYFAGNAYCKAMPIMSSYESIQAYVACAAHGLLMGALQPDKSGQILYAAQVALNTLTCQSRSQKTDAA